MTIEALSSVAQITYNIGKKIATIQQKKKVSLPTDQDIINEIDQFLEKASQVLIFLTQLCICMYWF